MQTFGLCNNALSPIGISDMVQPNPATPTEIVRGLVQQSFLFALHSPKDILKPVV